MHTGAVSESLLMLNDTPPSYADQHHKILRVVNNAVEFATVSEALQEGGLNELRVDSDQALKEDIVPMDCEEVADRFNRLTVCQYNYKTDADKKPRMGFIAQEVEKEFPSTVEDGPDHKSIDYIALVGALSATVQHQSKVIKSLETRMDRVAEAVHADENACVK